MNLAIKLMLLLAISIFSKIWSLPTYSFRSGRVCANCHATPFKTSKQNAWKNPGLASRKCNLSCQSCHINPAGGGLRTSPGRYYAMSTLPMFGAKKRAYHDAKNLELKKQILKFKAFFKNKSTSALAPKKIATQKAELSELKEAKVSQDEVTKNLQKQNTTTEQTSKQFEPRWYYADDFLSYGYPLDAATIAEQSEYAFDRDRYATINADPFLTLGGDARSALYMVEEIASVFPMQLDAGFALHPIEHITLSATAGLQGRTSGLTGNDTDRNKTKMKVQNAFVLLHELPYMSYVQGGLFLPEFGLRLDDHTLANRRQFEMDNSFSSYNARGVQVGLAPNYPYASAAIFETIDRNQKKTGEGYTLNAAWRGIVWGLGSSLMQKDRSYDNGGKLMAVSVNGYYNLWGLFPSTRYTNPIILQFEYNVGQKPRTNIHNKVFSTWLFQVDYLVLAGLNLRVYQSFVDPDWKIKDDAENRLGLGFDLTIYRGIRLTTDIRIAMLSAGEGGSDFIFFLHGYL